jgi:hypothetical protein
MLRLRLVVKGLFAMIRNLLIFLMISMSGAELIAQSVNTGQPRRLSGDILMQQELLGMLPSNGPILNHDMNVILKSNEILTMEPE